MPDLEYEIAQSKDLPQKVNEKIFNKQKERFGFTYRDEDVMYIVFGFGEQPTGGIEGWDGQDHSGSKLAASWERRGDFSVAQLSCHDPENPGQR